LESLSQIIKGSCRASRLNVFLSFAVQHPSPSALRKEGTCLGEKTRLHICHLESWADARSRRNLPRIHHSSRSLRKPADLKASCSS